MEANKIETSVKNLSNPLAIQPDLATKKQKFSWTILLFPDQPGFEEARRKVSKFAIPEAATSKEHIFRMKAESLWNAAARKKGLSRPEQVIEVLEEYGIYPISPQTKREITVLMSRYGLLELYQAEPEETFTSEPTLKLVSKEAKILQQALKIDPRIGSFRLKGSTDDTWFISPHHRGRLKQFFAWAGFPIVDKAAYQKGILLNIELRRITREGLPFRLRDYQNEAIKSFFQREAGAREGLVVLPPGTGKTIVGLGLMTKMKVHTLIVARDVVALWQWKWELLDKTTLTEDEIGEYWSKKKEIKPVTITTYHILSRHWKPASERQLTHLDLFLHPAWGLIIYDEVHSLPATVFRTTAEIQGIARLGMTATLIREDGRELDVFSLIGPYCYDYSWQRAEKERWTAKVILQTIIVKLKPIDKKKYRKTNSAKQRILAWENPRKVMVLEALLEKHHYDFVLISGEFVKTGFLRKISEKFKIPFLHGHISHEKRQEIYDQFRLGQINRILLTRIGDMAVNLPDANVLIQLNGNYGSRQQEAQRLGRLLRPKNGRAHFYSLVSDVPIEKGKFREKRESWLRSHGYQYREEDESIYLKERS